MQKLLKLQRKAMQAGLYKSYGGVPVSGDTLCSCMAGYKAPRARLALLQRRGELVSLRRNLFVCTDGEHAYSRFLIANHLMLSYVSFESALAQAGLIPERVYTVTSSCLARSRSVSNATGNYRFVQMPQPYFGIGVTAGQTEEGYRYLIARPEKALCDVIVAAPRLRLQSPKAAETYLTDFLRIDPEDWRALNPDIIAECAEKAHKKNRDLATLHTLISHEHI